MDPRLIRCVADYEQVATWWKAQSWPVIPATMLPPTGFILDGLCAGFLYKTDSAIAWLEFVVCNPAAPKEERRRGLDIIITRLCEEARKLGFKSIFSSVSHPGLIERYKRHGFVETDQGMTNLVRSI